MKNKDDIKREIESKTDSLKNNYRRAYEYHKKLFANDYPIKNIQGKKEYPYTNTDYEMKASEYIFYKFDTLDIGAKVALSQQNYVVVEETYINYSIFKNCNIKNIIFRRCSFSGSKFIKVNFEHVVFENCMFSLPVIEVGDVNDTYYAPTIFEGCIFVGRFLGCDVEYVLFERTNYTLSKFQRSSLQYSVMDTCAMSGVEMQDCNLQDFSINNTDIIDISFPDERITSVNENTLLDYGIKTKRKKANEENDSGWIPSNYDDMCLKKSRTIRNMSRLFAENGYPDYEGEYFYRAKRAELKGLHGFDKLKSIAALFLCGYGERPVFTLGTIVITTLLFGIVYMFTGVDAAGDVIKYTLGGSTPIIVLIGDYGKCLFFSVTTFSTVGYGNYVPLGSISMVASGIHMIIGVSLCALWTGCIFHKIVR